MEPRDGGEGDPRCRAGTPPVGLKRDAEQNDPTIIPGGKSGEKVQTWIWLPVGIGKVGNNTYKKNKKLACG